MIEVTVEGGFAAAHSLRHYKGDCESLHGHNWRVEATVSGENLDNAGMLIDFRALKESLNATLGMLDHKYLNELELFKEQNTTTENIAKFIFHKMKEGLPTGIEMRRIRVWETAQCSVAYEE